MNPRIDIITLAASAPEQALQFYKHGFGATATADREAPLVSFGPGASPLEVRAWEAVAAEAGVASDSRGFRRFTLSYILKSADQVDQLLERAEQHGGRVSKPPKNAAWGYSAYVTDPSGHLWKVASSKRRRLIAGKRPASANGHPITPKELPLTIGVADVKRAKTFYEDGLGLTVKKAFGSKFVMFSGGEGTSDLGIYKRTALANDAAVEPEGTGFPGFTLTHVMGSAAQVDELLARVEQAGGRILTPAVGGSNGSPRHFADLDSNVWRIATSH